MPEITGKYKSTARDYYKIVFTKDGYPAKYQGDSLFDHPIYGAYIINHYLDRYEKGEDSLKKYIEIVAKASLKRMTKEGNSLLMKYPKGYTRSEISGLTQSRYLIQFAKLYDVFNDSLYLSTAKGIFNSFTIPISEGGFHNEFDKGISFEEYPEKPVSFVLNGWLTALWNIHLYKSIVKDPLADSIFTKSCHTLAKLLPLYDYPEKKNSLYDLLGRQKAKIEFDEDDELLIKNLRVEIPKHYTYTFSLKEEKHESNYHPYLNEKDVMVKSNSFSPVSKSIRINLITSLISYPQRNILQMNIVCTEKNQMFFSYATGYSSPITSFMTVEEYQQDTTINLKKGTNLVTIPISYNKTRISLMPTQFSKKINGIYHNAYHYIHIDKLNKLYEVTRIEEFKYWADKWEEYTKEWNDLPLLQDNRLSVEPI